MNYISYPLSGFFSPSKDKVDSIMQVLNNPYYWPIFIHCKHGQDRTGLIIGLYRVFYQEWTPKEAYQEMIRYGFHPWLLGLRFYYKKETGY
jgi:protein tyrosine/serine phosphatase